MGRVPRAVSENGMYNIYFCGINKQNLFLSDADCEYFLDLLIKIKNELIFELYAYCIKGSQVRLFIKENNSKTLSAFMHKLLLGYASYFNKKYQRSGSLFENRYKSEPVSEDDAYYVISFIHKCADRNYKYSSFYNYFEEYSVCNDDFKDYELFEEAHKGDIQNGFDLADAQGVKLRKAYIKMCDLLEDIAPEEVISLPKKERDEKLKMLRENGFTIGTLMNVTGASRSVVTRCIKKEPKIANKTDMQVFLL